MAVTVTLPLSILSDSFGDCLVWPWRQGGFTVASLPAS